MAPEKKPPTGTTEPTTPTRMPKTATDFSNMLATALRPLLEQMSNINNKLNGDQKQLMGIDKRADKTDIPLKKVVAKTKDKQNVEEVGKEQVSDKGQLLLLQMERSMYVLHFQGIPEQKGENVKELLSQALVPVMELKQDLLQNNMDLAYQTYPGFIKKNKLPGEIFVIFLKRSTRDAVLKATSGKTLKVKDQEARILKDIPFEVRKRRQQYKDLTSFLQNNSAPYRWIFPEGLLFNYNDKKIRTDSAQKAKDFFEQQQSSMKDERKNKDSIQEEEKSECESEDTSSSSGSTSKVLDSEKGDANLKFNRNTRKVNVKNKQEEQQSIMDYKLPVD